MAANAYLKIYSNDGSTLLFTSTTMTSANDEGAVTSTGFEFTVNSGNGTETYTYSGNLKFLGFSTSANKTTPDYAIGDTIGALGGGVSVLYIVEEEAAAGVTIKYKDTTIPVEAGQTVTLNTADKKLTGDIAITAAEESGGGSVNEYQTLTLKNNGDYRLDFAVDGSITEGLASIGSLISGQSRDLSEVTSCVRCSVPYYINKANCVFTNCSVEWSNEYSPEKCKIIPTGANAVAEVYSVNDD